MSDEKKKQITIRPSTGAPFSYKYAPLDIIYAPLDIIVEQVEPLFHALFLTQCPKGVQTMSDELTVKVPAPLDPQTLIAKAIEHNMPVDTMERLLALREKLRDEQARTEFFTALSAFQSECPVIAKTKQITIRPSTGAPFTYHYAPLDVIVAQVGPLLTRHGLSYTMKPRQTETHLTAVCVVHHVAGHSEPSEVTVPIDKGARMGEAQKVGAASTYAARYAFCAAFGILTGDEDTDGGEPFKHEAFPPPPVKGKERVVEEEKAVEAVPVAGERVSSEVKENINKALDMVEQHYTSEESPRTIGLQSQATIYAKLRSLSKTHKDPNARFDVLLLELHKKMDRDLGVKHMRELSVAQRQTVLGWLEGAEAKKGHAKEVRRGK